jgi:hypothetical protein
MNGFIPEPNFRRYNFLPGRYILAPVIKQSTGILKLKLPIQIDPKISIPIIYSLHIFIYIVLLINYNIFIFDHSGTLDQNLCIYFCIFYLIECAQSDKFRCL